MSTTGIVGDTSSPSVCISCRLNVPTRWVEFNQNIGMLFRRRTTKMQGPMCRHCIWAYFKSYTLTTLFLGWWGLMSFVVTPIFLAGNIVQFWKSRSLPEPSTMIVANVPYGESPSTRIRVGTPSLAFKLTYGAIIWTVVLFLAAQQSVNFIEKHAPGLNAELHSGEITDDADAQYVVLKVAEDIQQLGAPPKSKSWTAARAELLARKPLLDDLAAKNAKLQGAAASERASGAAKNDPCEQLAINQWVPAVNDYTNAQEQFFSLLRATTTLTQGTRASINQALNRSQQAGEEISAYFSKAKARGCTN